MVPAMSFANGCALVSGRRRLGGHAFGQAHEGLLAARKAEIGSSAVGRQAQRLAAGQCHDGLGRVRDVDRCRCCRVSSRREICGRATIDRPGAGHLIALGESELRRIGKQDDLVANREKTDACGGVLSEATGEGVALFQRRDGEIGSIDGRSGQKHGGEGHGCQVKSVHCISFMSAGKAIKRLVTKKPRPRFGLDGESTFSETEASPKPSAVVARIVVSTHNPGKIVSLQYLNRKYRIFSRFISGLICCS